MTKSIAERLQINLLRSAYLRVGDINAAIDVDPQGEQIVTDHASLLTREATLSRYRLKLRATTHIGDRDICQTLQLVAICHLRRGKKEQDLHGIKLGLLTYRIIGLKVPDALIAEVLDMLVTHSSDDTIPRHAAKMFAAIRLAEFNQKNSRRRPVFIQLVRKKRI